MSCFTVFRLFSLLFLICYIIHPDYSVIVSNKLPYTEIWVTIGKWALLIPIGIIIASFFTSSQLVRYITYIKLVTTIVISAKIITTGVLMGEYIDVGIGSIYSPIPMKTKIQIFEIYLNENITIIKDNTDLSFHNNYLPEILKHINAHLDIPKLSTLSTREIKTYVNTLTLNAILDGEFIKPNLISKIIAGIFD